MATIAQIVAQIRTAIFGRDVRENIAQGIEKCYDDVTTGATVADAAAENANTKAGLANDAATLANTKAGLADAAATAANTAAAAAENVNASVSKSGNTVTFSVTNRNGVTSTADLSMEGSIDDTKGIGDTDFVWSADQNDKLYGIQDDRTNELYGYVNYGYDECNQINATNTYAYGCKRNKTIYTFTGQNTSSYAGRIKICNDMVRAVTAAGVQDFTDGIFLTSGHKYRLVEKRISGTSLDGDNNPRCPQVTIYVKGSSSSAGTAYRTEDGYTYVREFTADTSEYMVCFYVPTSTYFTNYICSVTLEDLDVESASDSPVTKAPVIDEAIDIPSDVQTFADGADNMPMNLEVGFSPLQDLHGYSYPWAGGNGKNLFSGFRSKSSSVVTSNNIPVDFSANTYYTFSGLTNEINCYAHAFEADDTFVGRNTGAKRSTMTLQKTSFSSGGGSQNYDSIAHIQLRYYNSPSDWGVDDADELPTQLEVGDTATTYEPYENICPITGHTASKIYHTGKNLFAGDYAEWVNNKTIDSEGEIIDNSSYRYSDTYFRINGGANIVAQATIVTTTSSGTMLVEYDANKNFIQRDSIISATGQTTGDKVITITTDANCRYFRMITPKTAPPSNIMISYGTTASDYESNSNVYDITFPTSAGTVYGGTLTINEDGTGVLNSKYDYVETRGNGKVYRVGSDTALGWSGNVSGGYVFFTASSSETGVIADSDICNLYPHGGSDTDKSVRVYRSTSTSRFLIRDSSIPGMSEAETGAEMVAAAEAYFASLYEQNIKLQAIWELTSPNVYYLDAQQVRTLLGLNNIWCNDAGQVINSITYPTDTKTYIDNQNADGMIAQTEASMTATKAYAEGELFTVKSKLYKATAAIAIGDALVTGTNCTETTVADECVNNGSAGMIAQTEDSMIATKDYAEGELFAVYSTLYKATSAIAIGDALVIGTNCIETTVANEISAILNSTATGVSF